LLGKTIALQRDEDNTIRRIGSCKFLSHVDVWIKNEAEFYAGTVQPHSNDLITSLAHFAAYYEQQGRYKSAELVTHRLIKHHKQWGEADSRYLNAVMNWASVCRHAGSYNNARNGFKTVALKRAELLGPSDVATLRSMMAWASCECSLQQYAESEKILRDILREQTKKMSLSLRDLLETMSELADVYRHGEAGHGRTVLWESRYRTSEPTRS
jgi:tetratricopeptide (TPR) repeat protein